MEGGEMRTFLLRALVALLAAALLGGLSASGAMAYGAANWQLAFSGTGSSPLLGSFGFWGWCDFAGGTSFTASGLATAGTRGDCEYAYYSRTPAVSATCHESLDLNGWYIGTNGDWFFSGTATVKPAAQTAFCESLPGNPATSSFGFMDSLIPAAPGHLNLNGLTIGPFSFTELQIQNTPIS
jgi:hypothetical protein